MVADVLFPEPRLVVGTETLNCALKLDSYISIVKASEPAGKQKGSTGVVAEYLKELVQVVHSATPLAVHPMKDRLAGVSVHGCEDGDPVLGLCPFNEKASFQHRFLNPLAPRGTFLPHV